jgi:hypothetical protein
MIFFFSGLADREWLVACVIDVTDSVLYVHRMTSTVAPAALSPTELSHQETDKWIECLVGCKALSEVEIRALCEKVRFCLLRRVSARLSLKRFAELLP